MKKTQIEIDAEAALASKAQEVTSAKRRMECLEKEYDELLESQYQARIKTDSVLPQCSMTRGFGREKTDERVVILRLTPGGLLVVRRVGANSELTLKFKWDEYALNYTQAESKMFSGGAYRKLENVPIEYIPS